MLLLESSSASWAQLLSCRRNCSPPFANFPSRYSVMPASRRRISNGRASSQRCWLYRRYPGGIFTVYGDYGAGETQAVHWPYGGKLNDLSFVSTQMRTSFVRRFCVTSLPAGNGSKGLTSATTITPLPPLGGA